MAATPKDNPTPKPKMTRRQLRRNDRHKLPKSKANGRIRTRPKTPEADSAYSDSRIEKHTVRMANPADRKERTRGKPKPGREYRPLIYAKNGMRIGDLEHDTGYCKPPETGKFKPGQSGNPRGRPKSRKNLSTLFGDALKRKIVSRNGNCEKTITAREGIALKAVQKALEGDPRFVKLVMEQDNLFDIELLQEQIEQAATYEIDEDDIDILEEFKRQILEKQRSPLCEHEDDGSSSGDLKNDSGEDDDDNT